jgi:hypothetical protein
MDVPLQYFETNVLGAVIMDAWQNQLGTESDPANGKWFRNGPNNSPGLFGGLTDELATQLVFSQGQAAVNRQKQVAATTTLDNRAGLLNDSPATQTLSWQITNSSTASHTTSNSVKTSIAEKVTVKGSGFFVDVTSETTISFEYLYSWSDTSSNTTTDTKTFTATIPLKVPAGKVYKLVVMADTDAVQIPYSAQIYLAGTSEANFANPVNGKQNWSADAGTLCLWIKKYGSGKADALVFDADPADPTRGIASLKGTMRATQSVNFTIFALDVTATYDGDPSATQAVSRLINGNTPPQVIAKQPVPASAGT